jgi:hypothetical protein
MESKPIEVRSLKANELDMISGGRTCNHGPPRVEVSIQFGPDVLVFWRTSNCTGHYWYTK